MSNVAHRGKTVIMVDGTCVFCNRLVSFILERDRAGQFFFANLQSNFAREALARHHAPQDPNFDGVYALVNADTDKERLCLDGAAGREIWPKIFPAATLLRWVPLPLLNLQYRLFARVRFKLFGQYDQCRIPTESERARCLE